MFSILASLGLFAELCFFVAIVKTEGFTNDSESGKMIGIFGLSLSIAFGLLALLSNA